jgi:uncharacterized membrane protein/heat shock protein HslJ
MNHKRTASTLSIIALSAVTLSACTPTLRGERGQVPAGDAYFALGTEPFWSVEITDARIAFDRPGERQIVADNPGARPSFNGRRYVTRAVTVDITATPCSDGMSDRRYPDTVSVTAGGRTWRGCGGAAMPMRGGSLDRSSWRITAINGAPAARGVTAELQFAEGRVSGTAGCNRLMGQYMQTRNQLTIDALAMTRMACMGPGGTQEDRVTAILSQPMTVAFGERMTATLTAADGQTISLARQDWD